MKNLLNILVMKTSKRHARLYQLWRDDFFNQLETEHFANSNDFGRVSYLADELTLKQSKSLGKKLISLFKYLKVDPMSPNWLGVSFSFLLTGENDQKNPNELPSVTEVFADGGALFDGFAKITIQRLIPRKKEDA